MIGDVPGGATRGETGGAGPGIRFTVNGRPAGSAAVPETALLYVLRNELGLTAARFGCGAGQCGACTVIVDGRAEPSCMLPFGAVAGSRIETAEGLVGSDPPHPLVTAFVKANAGQCGFCLAGIVMRAKALLDARPKATRAEIAAALDGNLCRCGSHVRILRAVARAAEAAR